MGFILGINENINFNIHKPVNVIHHFNKRKDKNHMITSIEEKKAFNKIQHPFMTKTLIKVGLEETETYLNIIKTIYDKPTVIMIHNDKKQKAFS